jgi:microcystin-dependent protein
MADTLTPNYGWVQPAVGADASTWGTTLNNDLNLIDAQVWANEQGVSPIGSVVMFAGATAPTNWLLCQGQSLATTGTYAKLFAVLQYTFGGSGANFNLPNLSQNFPLGAVSGTLGQVGGTFSYTIPAASLPPHNHGISDPGHLHSIAQTPHNHGDPGHAHGVNDGGHAHSGSVPFQSTGAGFGQFLPPSPAQSGGATGFNTSVSGTGISIQGSGTGIQAAYANINGNVTTSAGTGINATGTSGSGAAMSIVPPYIELNFIIRYQ